MMRSFSPFVVVSLISITVFNVLIANASSLFLLENDIEEQILALVRYSADHFLKSGRQISLEDVSPDILPLDSPLRKNALGVFITYILDGRSRGCYGSIMPRFPSIAEELLQVSIEALWAESTKPPLTYEELSRAEISVVLVEHLEPVNNPLSIDPFSQGLFVQSGDLSAILLPGEAQTARYAVEWILQKAGIKNVSNANFYSFRGIHFGAKLLLPNQ